MKCPKCEYLGFEATERCRNCGYEFALAREVTPAADLPLHDTRGAGAAFGDFDLGRTEPREIGDASRVDLDRLIGVSDTSPGTGTGGAEHRFAAPAAVSRPSSAPPRRGDRMQTPVLPLFSVGGESVDDTPLITTPRPVRPPLAVRRSTPDPRRGRSRTPRPPRRETSDVEFPLDTDRQQAEGAAPEDAAPPRDAAADSSPAAGHGARMAAVLVDVLLLGAINAAILYLTLAIAGLSMADAGILPRAPLAAFLLLLNGGYLVVFTAASGQTIGKMAAGIRVLTDEGRQVDVASAVVRSLGWLLGVAAAGLGYLPALLGPDRRAFHDRIARTRVVRIA
jgi:uncharacterized RDD family membrane protein YckC